MTKSPVDMNAARLSLNALAVGSLATSLAAAGAPPAWAQAPVDPYYGPHMWGGGSWMFFGPLMMILLVAVIVVVVFIAVRWLGGSGQATTAGRPLDRTPLDILKERFARGEIDQAEFEQRRTALKE